MPPETISLTHSTSKALRWNYIGSIFRILLGFAVNVLLARLLGPAPFGEIAVAAILFGFGNLLTNAGIGTALIQKEELSDRDVRICFTGQVLSGAIISTLLFCTAPAWASFFHDENLKLVLKVLAPMFLFQSLGTTSAALLSRAQNTRPLQVATLISYFCAYCGLALPLAFLGYGVWSLVGAYLLQPIVNSVLLYREVRHPAKPLIHRDGMSLFRFGVYTTGSNICNWGISNLDNTVVGRFRGPVSLGLYSRAFNLAQLPIDFIVGNLQQVMLPAFSRAQSDGGRLARAYLTLAGLVGIALFPPCAAMATAPGVVILGLYGGKWSGAIPLFSPLALALPVHALMALAGPILAARGKPQVELRVQLAMVVVALPAYMLGVHASLTSLAWIVLGIYCLRMVLLTKALLLEIEVRWQFLFRALLPGICVSLVASASSFLASLILPGGPNLVRLITTGGATLTVYLSLLFLGRRYLLEPILKDSPQVREILLSRLRRFIAPNPA